MLRNQMLTYLRRYAEAGRPIPSQTTIAGDFGISGPQVCRHLGLLKGAGLVEIERREAVYFASFPSAGGMA